MPKWRVQMLFNKHSFDWFLQNRREREKSRWGCLLSGDGLPEHPGAPGSEHSPGMPQCRWQDVGHFHSIPEMEDPRTDWALWASSSSLPGLILSTQPLPIVHRAPDTLTFLLFCKPMCFFRLQGLCTCSSLFPLPARFSHQPFTWFLFIIRVSAQVPPPLGGLPDSALQSLPPIPVSPAFGFLSRKWTCLFSCLLHVSFLYPKQKRSLRARDFVHPGYNCVFRTKTVPCEVNTISICWMNVLGAVSTTRDLAGPGWSPGTQDSRHHPTPPRRVSALFSLGLSAAGRPRVFWVWFL